MSSNYSANQYDGAFRSQRLQNWALTRRDTGAPRPAAKRGPTVFIADDEGHLHRGRGKPGSAWPDFKGTWDPPARGPAHRVNPTARSEDGLRRLRAMGFTEDREGPRGTGQQEAPLPESAPGTGGEGPGSSPGPAPSPGPGEAAAGPENPASDQ